MAAWETFTAVTGSLTEPQRDALKDVLRYTNEDLLAARCEEARVRIVNDLLRDVREALKPVRK